MCVTGDAVLVRKRRCFLTENDAVSGVFGVTNCVVIDAVCGICCLLEDDPVFARAPPATAVQPFENALGLQLADYPLNVPTIEVRLVGNPLRANLGDPRLDDPMRARFPAGLSGVAGDDEQHPKFTAGQVERSQPPRDHSEMRARHRSGRRRPRLNSTTPSVVISPAGSSPFALPASPPSASFSKNSRILVGDAMSCLQTLPVGSGLLRLLSVRGTGGW